MRTQSNCISSHSAAQLDQVKLGNFTKLSQDYDNRPGYSHKVLRLLAAHVGAKKTSEDFRIADVGAGTGKLSLDLAELGYACTAVEPNAAMMQKGQENTQSYPINWRSGCGEQTGLATSSIDWLLMASSFHWVDLEKGLAEFYRVIRPGGFFTALWNPRDVTKSELHQRIEKRIFTIVPDLDRVSSGSARYTQNLAERLQSTGHFEDLLFVESEYKLDVPRAKYIGAWRSVNDIQSQAGPERFTKILEAIEEELGDREIITIPYKTRAWTVRRKSSVIIDTRAP